MSPMELEVYYSPNQIRAIQEQEAQIGHNIKFGLFTGGGGLNSPLQFTPGGGTTIPGSGGPTGGGIAGIGAAACNLITNAAARAACIAAAGLFLPGGTGTPAGTGTPLQTAPECAKGMVRVGNRCVSPGDVFPGGAPFITPAGGVPVAGSFGLPGYQPLHVQQAVRRCPAGFALAKDGICYVRSQIPRKFRMHAPSKRPPLTGADASALRRIGSLQTRVKRLAKVAGLSMTAKRTARKPARKR